MGITFDSFVQWTAFQPGPLFPAARKSSGFKFDWARSIQPGASTAVMPAVPSVLDAPHPEEWQADVSTIEWRTLAPIWEGVARTLLVNDPVFKPFQHAYYVTADGTWTDQGRKHPTFDVLREELVIRMEEEFAWHRQFLNRAKEGAPSLAEQDLAELGRPRAQSGEDDEWSALRLKWLKLAWEGVERGWKAARLFSPQGIGWIVVEHAAEYGYHRYKEHQERQERARQRAERREQRRNRRNLSELDWPADVETSADDQVRGFRPETPTAGLLVTEGPSASFKFSGVIGAPKVLTSQDGIYL